MKKYVKDFLKYLEYELNYSAHTVKNYEIDLNAFFKYADDQKVTYDLIRDYLAYLNEKNYSKKTVARKISSLKSYYRYLNSEKIASDNPVELISNPKLDKRLPKVLNYEQIDEILKIFDDSAIGLRDSLIVELLYSTGIRVSELVNIKIEDINYSDKKIKILGKGNKERYTYFGTPCLKKLKKYQKSREELLKGEDEGYLFLNKRGKKLSDRSVRFIIDEISKKANLDMHISPHVFRHTYATDMLNEGADLKSVQKLLGHENMSTTQIYTHISNEYLRKTYLNCHPRAKK